MKVNKLFLGILGAIAIVSTADAGVRVVEITEDACNQREGMVWVGKNEECIPMNPCSDDNFIDEYCENLYIGNKPVCGVDLDMLFGKYAENVLNTSLYEYVKVEDEGPGNYASYGLKTADGGYTIIRCNNYGEDRDTSLMTTASWAYGHNPAYMNSVSIDENYKAQGYSVTSLQIVEDISESECSEIVDFANSLSGKNFEYKIDEGRCFLIIPNPEYNQF